LVVESLLAAAKDVLLDSALTLPTETLDTVVSLDRSASDDIDATIIQNSVRDNLSVCHYFASNSDAAVHLRCAKALLLEVVLHGTVSLLVKTWKLQQNI